MKEAVLLLAALSSVTFIGWNVLRLMSGKNLRMSLPETIAVSYGFGVGFISLEMLLFYSMGLNFMASHILLPWVIVIAANFVVRSRRPKVPAPVPSAPCASSWTKAMNVFLAGGIIFEIAYAFFRALIKPIESYDAIAIYAIRSKIFFLAKSIPKDYFSSIAKLFPHADYPMNIQLFETFLYSAMGSLNDQLVKIIFPLFFAAILCVFYFAVRRFAGRTYALCFTFILASVPHFNNYATNAYLEVPLAFYIFVSGIFLLRWAEDNGSTPALILSAVAAALAGWTKNEGLMYCVIYAGLVFLTVASKLGKVSRKDIFNALLYSGIILCILLPWALIKSKWHIVNDEIALGNLNPANLFKQLHKLGPVFYELQKQLFGPKKWNILWPVFILVMLANYRKVIGFPQRYVGAVILMALGGYALFYMISYVDVVFFASKTWARFMLDFLPLAVYLLAVTLKEDIKC
jgi:hypothetical protein